MPELGPIFCPRTYKVIAAQPQDKTASYLLTLRMTAIQFFPLIQVEDNFKHSGYLLRWVLQTADCHIVSQNQ